MEAFLHTSKRQNPRKGVTSIQVPERESISHTGTSKTNISQDLAVELMNLTGCENFFTIQDAISDVDEFLETHLDASNTLEFVQPIKAIRDWFSVGVANQVGTSLNKATLRENVHQEEDLE